MKIGVFGSVPYNLIFGGGETQLINTMSSLKAMGIDIGYYEMWNKAYTCDIVHMFGCHYWLYQWAFLAKSKGMKIALSTISYTQCKMTFERSVYDKFDKMLPCETTYRLNRKLIQLADVLLPNSKEECKYLDEILGASNKKKVIIPNATDLKYKSGNKNNVFKKYGIKNYVLCVGKIEPRKNQLQLVKALQGMEIPLILLGSFIPNDINYYKEVMKVVNNNKNMRHIEYLPYGSNELADLYAGAKVHVLLGKNETPGIVNLEAGLAGANLVVADCAPVKEYFGDYAIYADYLSIDDIRNKIKSAYLLPKNSKTSVYIEENFTWKIVAEKTLKAYNQILG